MASQIRSRSNDSTPADNILTLVLYSNLTVKNPALLQLIQFTCLACIEHGPFRGQTRGNAFPIVKVLFKNALRTALRTIFRPKLHLITRFCVYTICKCFFSGSHTAAGLCIRRRAVLGPRHQFPLGSPALPSFLFYETITGIRAYFFAPPCLCTAMFMRFLS